MEIQTTLSSYVLQVLWVIEKASGRQDRFNYLVQTAPLSSWSLKRKIVDVVHCSGVLRELTSSGIKQNPYPMLQTSTASHFNVHTKPTALTVPYMFSCKESFMIVSSSVHQLELALGSTLFQVASTRFETLLSNFCQHGNNERVKRRKCKSGSALSTRQHLEKTVADGKASIAGRGCSRPAWPLPASTAGTGQVPSGTTSLQQFCWVCFLVLAIISKRQRDEPLHCI